MQVERNPKLDSSPDKQYVEPTDFSATQNVIKYTHHIEIM